MSKRSEIAALRAYPFIPLPQYDLRDENPTDGNKIHRKIFLEGYEQAEKDTIERAISVLVNLPSLVIPSNYIAYFREKMMEENNG